MSVLSKRHGISETTLGRWREDFIASGTEGLGSGTGRQRAQPHLVSRLEADVAERDRVIGELTIANRLLK